MEPRTDRWCLMADLLTRELRVSVRALNEDEGEYEFTAATEAPVDMGLDAPECLRIDGAEFDASIPLLDAHNRRSSASVIGRAFLRKDGRSLVARVRFSKATKRSRDASALVKDRSIDSCSIGYLVEQCREIRDGEVDGEGESAVNGPAYVVSRWRVKELSIVPIGADPNARRRAFEAASKETPVSKKKEKRDETVKDDVVDDKKAEAPETEESEGRDDADGDAEPEMGRCRGCGRDAELADFRAYRDEISQDEGQEPVRTLEEQLVAERTKTLELQKRESDAKKAELEARKALILTRWPASLREFLDELLISKPEIAPAEAWRDGLEELRRRMPPGGTPEPKNTGAQIKKPDSASSETNANPEERIGDGIVNLLKIR